MRVASYNWTGYGTKDKDTSLPLKKFETKKMVFEGEPRQTGERVYYYDTPDLFYAKHGGFLRILQSTEEPNTCLVEYARGRRTRVYRKKLTDSQPSASVFSQAFEGKQIEEILRYSSAKKIFTAKYLDGRMLVDGRGAYVEVSGERCKIDRIKGKPANQTLRLWNIRDVSTKHGSWPRPEGNVSESVSEVFENFDQIMHEDVTTEKITGTRYCYLVDNLGLLQKKTKE